MEADGEHAGDEEVLYMCVRRDADEFIQEAAREGPRGVLAIPKIEFAAEFPSRSSTRSGGDFFSLSSPIPSCDSASSTRESAGMELTNRGGTTGGWRSAESSNPIFGDPGDAIRDPDRVSNELVGKFGRNLGSVPVSLLCLPPRSRPNTRTLFIGERSDFSLRGSV